MIVTVDTDETAATPIRVSWSSCTDPLHLTIFEASQLHFQIGTALMELDPHLRQWSEGFDKSLKFIEESK